jgi:TetR/AcrR family transcriptional regulator, tetracycline repressor protein
MFGMTQPAVPEPPWRTTPRRRGVPRPQLSREIVVDAALAVLEAGGGHALTMRRVAEQIGVSASALYGYVASKEELVQLVFERIGEELTLPETADGWQEMLKQFGRNLLAVFRRYPGVAALTMGRAVATPSTLAVGERMLAELRAAGIPDQVAAYVGDLGGLYVGGIAYELDAAPPADQTAAMVAQLAAWIKSLPPDRYPNTVALADKLVAGSAEDRFEWGLDVIVRGLASYLDKPPDPSARWPAG